MTTLHAGGKFDSKAYETSGGLHGVGVSVVNALSDELVTEVARDQVLYRQSYSRGKPTSKVIEGRHGAEPPRHDAALPSRPARSSATRREFSAQRLFKMTRAKAYLFGGVEIRWSCDPELATDDVPEKASFHFPGGLRDFLASRIEAEQRIVDDIFSGQTGKPGTHGAVEWAIAWTLADGFLNSYCNTIPTAEGGTHEQGLRTALLRGIRAYAELKGDKRAANITAEDLLVQCSAMLSVFVREPEFVGQTKDRLSSPEATRIVDKALSDAFDHWLAASPTAGQQAPRLDHRARRGAPAAQEGKGDRPPVGDAQAPPARQARRLHAVGGAGRRNLHRRGRQRRRQRQIRRATARARRSCRCAARCSTSPAPPARSSPPNQQIADLIQALGCGTRDRYREDDLRYDKIILMTDADVDGAHIASLLMTFFFQEMPALIDQGHLYLALPPLYRLSSGAKVALRHGRRRTATGCSPPNSRARSPTSRASRASARCPTCTCAKPRWTRRPARCCRSRSSRTATSTKDSVERLMGSQARDALRVHPGRTRSSSPTSTSDASRSHIKQSPGNPVDSRGFPAMFPAQSGTTPPPGR